MRHQANTTAAALSSTAIAVVLATSAHAQTVPGGAAQADSVEQIIVTATKREQNLSEIPASISAVSGEMLERKVQRQITDLNATAPGLQVTPNNAEVSVTIRGVGHALYSPAAENSVALHLDGVYLGRPAAAQSAFFDVSRVEVLRGPQGTLYGRNATGGAVNIVSNAPTDTFSGRVSAGMGNYQRTDLEGVVSGPIVPDVLLARAGVFFHKRGEGFGINLADGSKVDDLDESGAKLAIEARPSEKLKLLLRGDYYHADDAYGLYHFAANVRQPAPGVPSLPQALGSAPAADIRDTNFNQPNHRYADLWGTAFEASYAINDALSVKSVSAYRQTIARYQTDIDGGQLAIFDPFKFNAKSRQYSQELQLNWKGDNLYLVAGAYYFNEETRSQLYIDSYLAEGLPAMHIPPILPAPFGVFDQQARLKTEAKAVFANLDWDASNRLTLGFGLRYSQETKSNQGFNITFFPDYAHWPATGYIVVDDSRTSHGVTPRFTARYAVSDDLNVYGSVSRGFKSGEFIAGTTQYAKPEFVWAYEAGIKGDLFDRRLRGSLSAFYYDYSDLQVQRVQTPYTFLENAPKGTLKGVEGEGSLRLPAGVLVDGNFALLDTEVKGFITEDPNLPGNPVRDLTGNRFAMSPRFTYNVGVEKSLSLGPIGTGVLRVDYQHTSDTYLDIFNSRGTAFRPAYGLVNASYRHTLPAEGWSLLAWAKNLGDKTVHMSSTANQIPNLLVPTLPGFTPPYPSASVEMVNLNEPRTFGLTIERKW